MAIISRVEPTRGPAQLRSIQQFLRSLDRREIIKYLQAIVDDQSMLQTVTSRSSLHANGFAKIVLERHAKLALRLHIWTPVDPDQAEISENIHDHVWPFGSVILIGGLGEQRFISTKGGVVMDHYRYERARATLPPGRLAPLGQVRLNMLSEMLHPAGTIYQVEDTALHRAWSAREEGYAASLVLTGTPRESGASVYVRAGEHVREDIRDAQLLPEDVRRLIDVVIEALR